MECDLSKQYDTEQSAVAAIAQLAEHPLSKRKVVGSSPTGGSLFSN